MKIQVNDFRWSTFPQDNSPIQFNGRKFFITHTSLLSVEKYFSSENLFVFDKVNIMLNISIIIGLQPASLLKKKYSGRYFPRTLSAINKHL